MLINWSMQHLRDIECVWVWVWCEFCDRSNFCYLHEWRQTRLDDEHEKQYLLDIRQYIRMMQQFVYFTNEKKGKSALSLSPSSSSSSLSLSIGMHKYIWITQEFLARFNYYYYYYNIFECETNAFSNESNDAKMATRHLIQKRQFKNK